LHEEELSIEGCKEGAGMRHIIRGVGNGSLASALRTGLERKGKIRTQPGTMAHTMHRSPELLLYAYYSGETFTMCCRGGFSLLLGWVLAHIDVNY
jgi:hypothetical protein